jgi:hypothetical protein
MVVGISEYKGSIDLILKLFLGLTYDLLILISFRELLMNILDCIPVDEVVIIGLEVVRI